MFASTSRLFTLFLLLGTVPFAAANNAPRLYQTQTGNNISSSIWEIQTNQSAINMITTSNKGAINRFTISPTSHATTHWQYLNPSNNTHIQAVNRGNSVELSGVLKGKNVQQRCDLDQPWWQAIPWNLEQMLAQHRDQATFVAIRPDTLKCHTFIAKRLAVPAKDTTAQQVHVEVRLMGAYNKFWSAQYWFDAQDDTFIRYKAKHGMFAQPTIVQLQVFNQSPAAE